MDGKPFSVKGMHYGPWRPGTGPNKNYPYPAPELIDSDLKLIQGLNVNTILMADPPSYVLDLAQKRGLKVSTGGHSELLNSAPRVRTS